MKAKLYILLSIAVAALLLSSGCSNDEDDTSPTQPSAQSSDCFGCHTNQAMLVATMSPDTTPEPENPGEG